MSGVVSFAPFVPRAATDAEVPAITRLLQAAFAEQAPLAPPSGALAETDAKVRAVMQTAGVLVVVVDGVIAGCVFHAVEDDALYLFRLAVLPALRCRGIARALLDASETVARRRDLARMRLSVRLALSRQRAYYERLGYAVVGYGTHPGFTAPTSAALEKPLQPRDLIATRLP